MAQAILQRSKLLCYFTIDPALSNNSLPDPLLQPQTLPIIVYHFHYPALYYSTLHRHFKLYLSADITPNHLRLRCNGQELPSDQPLGLFLKQGDIVDVTVSQFASADPFRTVVTSWKRGYTIVNKEGGCDHVFKKLSEQQRKELYALHETGHSHRLHAVPKYEGNCIALKVFFKGDIVERKQQNLKQTIEKYLTRQFGDIFGGTYRVKMHGVQVDMSMNLKEVLEDWNYNDGYCYFCVE